MKLQANCHALIALTARVKNPEPAAQALCLSLACCPQRDAREVALRESWARERDAALDREQSAASTRIRDLSNRQALALHASNMMSQAETLNTSGCRMPLQAEASMHARDQDNVGWRMCLNSNSSSMGKLDLPFTFYNGFTATADAHRQVHYQLCEVHGKAHAEPRQVNLELCCTVRHLGT